MPAALAKVFDKAKRVLNYHAIKKEEKRRAHVKVSARILPLTLLLIVIKGRPREA